MQNGLAIIEMTDTGTKGLYIDQDALEFSRLNAKTKKRIAKAEAEKRESIRQHNKAEKAKARHKAQTISHVKAIVSFGAVFCGSAWAGLAGMIHPAIFIPVSLFCLCAACVRFGMVVKHNGASRNY